MYGYPTIQGYSQLSSVHVGPVYSVLSHPLEDWSTTSGVHLVIPPGADTCCGGAWSSCVQVSAGVWEPHTTCRHYCNVGDVTWWGGHYHIPLPPPPALLMQLEYVYGVLARLSVVWY